MQTKRYFGNADLANGPVPVTIATAVLEPVQYESGTKLCMVLYFKEDVPPLVLCNRTWIECGKLLGADRAGWQGQRVELYKCHVLNFGSYPVYAPLVRAIKADCEQQKGQEQWNTV